MHVRGGMGAAQYRVDTRCVCHARDVRLFARPVWHREAFPTVEGSPCFLYLSLPRGRVLKGLELVPRGG